MKRTTLTVDPTTEVPAGTIGVMVQSERSQAYTLGGIPYGAYSIRGLPYAAQYTRCFAVFPGKPLRPLGPQRGVPSHLKTRRKLIVLRPGQKTKVRIEDPLGSIGSYVFENRDGILRVRPAWLALSRKRLELRRTGECDISELFLRFVKPQKRRTPPRSQPQ